MCRKADEQFPNPMLLQSKEGHQKMNSVQEFVRAMNLSHTKLIKGQLRGVSPSSMVLQSNSFSKKDPVRPSNQDLTIYDQDPLDMFMSF